MCFKNSVRKVDQARAQCDAMARATETIGAQAAMTAYLNAAKAVTNSIQREGAHLEGFQAWWETKREEMRHDDLLAWVHRYRKATYHEAKEAILGSVTAAVYIDSSKQRPRPDAVLEVSTEGAYWVLDRGKPSERRLAAQGQHTVTGFTIRDAPKTHRGKAVKADAPTICRLSLAYYEELVAEAHERFQ